MTTKTFSDRAETTGAGYELLKREAFWQAYWEREALYHFDPESPAPVFSIDTPPPTVSGDLHVGHVFSYTQAEIIARYMRMRGYNVFYPFGFDDNGLPTERLVERERGLRGAAMPRSEFIATCLEVSRSYEERFRELWKSLGFSTEWGLLYSTIDERSRRISQRSFLDLYRKGIAYRQKAPTLFCPHCQTVVAQAETEDRLEPSRYLTIRFTLPGGGVLPIATTRPELLPALSAIFVNPEDGRYRALIGATARDPLFGLEARIMADEAADPEKGSGAVMCCAYGDATDVAWHARYGLAPRTVIGRDGLLTEAAGPYRGLAIKEARNRISADLLERGLAEAGPPIEHAVNVHERCGNDLEFVLAEEWFIRIMDRKKELEQIADTIQFRPAYMRERYTDWVRNLTWDWCISRQRFFGVPFPVWYCASCGAIKTASEEELPLDPGASLPRTPCACGSRDFIPERDVMDTWATSSVSPEINGLWGEQGDRMARLSPFSLRPQAHDIIRTWAFYTIVKSYYHHGRAPWKEVMISGHSRDPKGAKLSKSRGNTGVSPAALIARHGADPVRYWAAGSRLGSDTALSEEAIADGRRLVLKIWNAARLVRPFIAAAGRVEGEPTALEAWMLASFRRAAVIATRALDEREYSAALSAAEDFFRKDFCDYYLELVKPLLKKEGSPDRAEASATLYELLYGGIRLFAPFLPHITEEIYQSLFREREGILSIHRCPWPQAESLPGDKEALLVGAGLASFIDLVRKAKTEARRSLSSPIAALDYGLRRERLPETFPRAWEASLPRIRESLMIEGLTSSSEESLLAWNAEESIGIRVVNFGD